MRRILKQHYWHELFEAGVVVKAINSGWETLSGLLLLIAGPSIIEHIFVFVSRAELLGDREDIIFHFVDSQLQHLTSIHTRGFVGVYLLFHGIMNGFLAYNLFKNKLWAYPVAMAFNAVFFVYQCYRLYHTHSLILLAVTIFDIFFILLTWHEYHYQKARAHAHEQTHAPY